MTRWTFAAVVLALGLGSGALGCKKKSEDAGPPCEKVAEHVFEVTTKAFPGHGDMGAGNRKQYIEGCKARNMPAAERQCLMEAQDMLSLAKCRKIEGGKQQPPAKPPEATKPEASATPPEPAKPAAP